jgi:hypothetical protein
MVENSKDSVREVVDEKTTLYNERLFNVAFLVTYDLGLIFLLQIILVHC